MVRSGDKDTWYILCGLFVCFDKIEALRCATLTLTNNSIKLYWHLIERRKKNHFHSIWIKIQLFHFKTVQKTQLADISFQDPAFNMY